MTKLIVIAHQLGAELEQVLKSGLPPEILWRALPREAAWEVPDDAAILLAVPPRAGNVVVPDQAPAGWPRGLRWIHSISTGVDEYPKWLFDVPQLTCGRGTNSAAIAEYVLTSLLAVEKSFSEIWIRDAADWQPRELGTLHGKTLGLIGYGSIGQAVAARALPFGMRVIAARRSASGEANQDGVRFASLNTVLAEADQLVIAAPLTNATAGLIGRPALARVKPDLHLVNISRGRIIDHDALLEALNARRIGFATLDVTEPEPLPPEHPLYTHPRVHISPHISWSAGKRDHNAIALFKANLLKFIAGQDLEGRVNADFGY